ncbi:MAG: lipopolysaccharide biosynthesis protein [Candidatus Binatia bacterium]
MKDKKRVGRLSSPLIARSAIAFLDQAILSATNFLVSIILIRHVPKEEYGYYSIAFAVALFLVSIQDALVSSPVSVLLASKKEEARHTYVSAVYWGQFLFLVPTVCLGLLITIGLLYMGIDTVKVLTVGSICIAALGVLPREFARAYYFAEETPLTVLKLDSCYVAVYLGSISVTHLSCGISVPVVFVFMGVSGFLTAAIFNGCRRWRCDWASIRATYKENWNFGRWTLFGVFVTHIQSYCNLYLLGALLSGAAAGSVSASRLPLMPLALIQAGWNKIALPRGASLRESRQLHRFFKEQMLVSVIVGIGIVLYVSVLLMSADFLKQFLFTKEYESALNFIIFWGMINIASYAALNASCGLQVIREFSIIAKVNFVTMTITLSLNYVLIQTHGITGSLVSSLIGESLFAVVLWWLLRRRYFPQLELRRMWSGRKIFRWVFREKEISS